MNSDTQAPSEAEQIRLLALSMSMPASVANPNLITMKKPPWMCGTCGADIVDFHWDSKHECLEAKCQKCGEVWV